MSDIVLIGGKIILIRSHIFTVIYGSRPFCKDNCDYYKWCCHEIIRKTYKPILMCGLVYDYNGSTDYVLENGLVGYNLRIIGSRIRFKSNEMERPVFKSIRLSMFIALVFIIAKEGL